ncbi:hypothetical protein E2C01_000827 [Portunus trituberculatus]|uniref:Uncharacterized protein n=1 Tax=Portunus trituberculatus TaxID=210409 RepID=A0A5B7CFC7_PORTR|nr:hypothetical protein [Portunus trituberculatus]
MMPGEGREGVTLSPAPRDRGHGKTRRWFLRVRSLAASIKSTQTNFPVTFSIWNENQITMNSLYVNYLSPPREESHGEPALEVDVSAGSRSRGGNRGVGLAGQAAAGLGRGRSVARFRKAVKFSFVARLGLCA